MGGSESFEQTKEIYALRPWYHDFSSLGVDTTFYKQPLTVSEMAGRFWEFSSILKRFLGASKTSPVGNRKIRSPIEIFRRRPSSHHLNQPIKDSAILSHLAEALADLPSEANCLDLFCSDGYYSCHMKQLREDAEVVAIDLDEDHIKRGKTMAHILGFDHIAFVNEDVANYLSTTSAQFDVTLCAGGLYHVENPLYFIDLVTSCTTNYLIVQSVVTLETEAEDYFVQPANGWQHGCRFSHAWLKKQLMNFNWNIVREDLLELPGNRRLHDKGSSHFLCQR